MTREPASLFFSLPDREGLEPGRDLQREWQALYQLSYPATKLHKMQHDLKQLASCNLPGNQTSVVKGEHQNLV